MLIRREEFRGDIAETHCSEEEINIASTLMAELRDDSHTIRNLVSARNLGTCYLANRNSDPDFALEVIEGYPNSIEASLFTSLRSSSRARFRIIADADGNPAIFRWHSIAGYLRNLVEKPARLFDDLPHSSSASGMLLETDTGRIVGGQADWNSNARKHS